MSNYWKQKIFLFLLVKVLLSLKERVQWWAGPDLYLKGFKSIIRLLRADDFFIQFRDGNRTLLPCDRGNKSYPPQNLSVSYCDGAKLIKSGIFCLYGQRLPRFRKRAMGESSNCVCRRFIRTRCSASSYIFIRNPFR